MPRITLFSNTRGLIFAASQDGTKWDWENADSNQLQPTNNAASRVAMSQPYQGVYGEYGRPWPRDGSVGNRLQPEWAAVSFRCVLSWQQYPPPPSPSPATLVRAALRVHLRGGAAHRGKCSASVVERQPPRLCSLKSLTTAGIALRPTAAGGIGTTGPWGGFVAQNRERLGVVCS